MRNEGADSSSFSVFGSPLPCYPVVAALVPADADAFRKNGPTLRTHRAPARISPHEN